MRVTPSHASISRSPARSADRGGRDPGARRSARRRFERAVRLLLDCRGPRHRHRHGQVGHHLPQDRRTLSSTGTPALFLHPAEAIHGDLGVCRPTT
jgi:D-arabinose 5-phosphate isomerase GutQ